MVLKSFREIEDVKQIIVHNENIWAEGMLADLQISGILLTSMTKQCVN